MDKDDPFKTAVRGSLKLKGAASKKPRTKLDAPGKSPAEASKSASSLAGANQHGMTDAERKFEETQRKRKIDEMVKNRGKTHKDKVREFNDKLQRLSEHHDIPRVGPG